MKKMTIFIAIAALAALPVLYNNCGQSEITASKLLRSNTSGIADPLTTNQAPKINCDLMSADGSKTFRTVSTIDGNDIKWSDPTEADALKFDCADTADESPVAELSFSIDLDYDVNAPDFAPLAASYLPFSPTLRKSVALKATDAQGASSIKVFNLEVDCKEPVAAPNVAAANISVTPLAKKNHFDYNISGVVGDGLEYSWDFNGDGSFDAHTLGDFNKWTAESTLSDIYNIYGTSRKLKVNVRNACGKEVIVEKTVNIDVSNPLNGPGAYWYIQGTISGAHPTNAQRTNADVLVTKYPDDKPPRMDCQYILTGDKASFRVTGLNKYQDSVDYAAAESPYVHGLTLDVINIPDTGADGAQSFTMAEGISVPRATYSVATVDDSPDIHSKNEVFNKSDECQITLNMLRSTSETPCGSGPSAKSIAIQIYGTYSCPNMKSSTGRSINLDNGKYFCQAAIGNSCIGGGQGQGGAPPMPQ